VTYTEENKIFARNHRRKKGKKRLNTKKGERENHPLISTLAGESIAHLEKKKKKERGIRAHDTISRKRDKEKGKEKGTNLFSCRTRMSVYDIEEKRKKGKVRSLLRQS